MMQRGLRLCFSFIRRQAGGRQLLETSCGVGCKSSSSFLCSSLSWSKIPLTSISECDEDVESSVSSVTEPDSGDDVEHEKTGMPDLAKVCSSSRFFFSAPGSSSSIVEIATPSSTASAFLLLPSPPPVKVARNSLAVETYSVNPYVDFERSMQEMVEASRLMKKDTSARWSFLHEMLLCYLALNHKSTHKFIISAFADLLVNLVIAENGRGKYEPTEVGPTQHSM